MGRKEEGVEAASTYSTLDLGQPPSESRLRPGQRHGHSRRRCLRLCLGCPADRKPLASPRMLRPAGDNSAGFARFRLPGGAKTQSRVRGGVAVTWSGSRALGRRGPRLGTPDGCKPAQAACLPPSPSFAVRGPHGGTVAAKATEVWAQLTVTSWRPCKKTREFPGHQEALGGDTSPLLCGSFCPSRNAKKEGLGPSLSPSSERCWSIPWHLPHRP